MAAKLSDVWPLYNPEVDNLDPAFPPFLLISESNERNEDWEGRCSGNDWADHGTSSMIIERFMNHIAASHGSTYRGVRIVRKDGEVSALEAPDGAIAIVNTESRCSKCNHTLIRHKFGKQRCGVPKCHCESFEPAELLAHIPESIAKLEVKHSDPVAHPSHYTKGKIEVWDFIVDQGLNFLRGSAVKYVVRAGDKDPDKEIQDLEKAKAFIDREIKRIRDERDG